ncbi:MAG: DUF4926 domain-containing protein [Planctomycetaceae bacterium]
MGEAKILKEHDRVVLLSDVPSETLKAGDIGAIVHVYPKAQAFEVGFFALDGHTAAVATLASSQLRPVTDRDITHSREN